MKKTIIALFMLVSVSALAQKKDSVNVVITLDTTSYKQLLYVIQESIDSKKLTKEIIELLQKNAKLVADKPKKIN